MTDPIRRSSNRNRKLDLDGSPQKGFVFMTRGWKKKVTVIFLTYEQKRFKNGRKRSLYPEFR